MQEKWPPTVRKFCIFVAAISDLVCVCLCLGQVGWFSKYTWLFPFELGWCNKLWEDSAFLLWLLPAYVCVWCDVTGVVWKFRIFVAAISGLCVCMYVRVYVCAAMHDTTVIWKFRAFIAAISSLCVCLFALLCVWTGPGQLWGAHQLRVFLNLNLNVFPVASCHILQL